MDVLQIRTRRSDMMGNTPSWVGLVALFHDAVGPAGHGDGNFSRCTTNRRRWMRSWPRGGFLRRCRASESLTPQPPLSDMFSMATILDQRGPVMRSHTVPPLCMLHLDRLVRLGHGYELKVMMHCCGGYAPLIPQMRDWTPTACTRYNSLARGWIWPRSSAPLATRFSSMGRSTRTTC